MARYANPYAVPTYGGSAASPYPTDPNWAAGAASLGTALFGNPEQAAEAKLRQAQQQNFTAEAGNYLATAGKSNAEADAIRAKTAAGANLDALTTGAYAPADPDNPTAPRHIDPVGIAHLIAGLGVMGINDPTHIAQVLAASTGSDEGGRMAVTMGGASPTADFAVTPQRADLIAATAAGAKRAEAESVANLNGKYGVQEAGIHAGAEVKAAGISAGASKYGADRSFAAATQDSATRAASDKYKVDHGQEGKVSPSQLGAIDAEINAQFGDSKTRALPPQIQTAVRTRAVDLVHQTANPAGAVAQAIGELVTSTPSKIPFGIGGPKYSLKPPGNVIHYDNQGRRVP